MPNCSRKTITDPRPVAAQAAPAPAAFAAGVVSALANRCRTERPAIAINPGDSHRRSSTLVAPTSRNHAGDIADFLFRRHARTTADAAEMLAQFCANQLVRRAIGGAGEKYFSGGARPGSCPREAAMDRLRESHALRRTQEQRNKTA
jgi:hypothetical protein